ncbi:hypothetical protein T190_13200 [Sinorhizobium meliloti CCBAU 01290]|nr:hypothetical protein T190_13200 [Sinorhizobium meliloti CCBAU 01290]
MHFAFVSAQSTPSSETAMGAGFPGTRTRRPASKLTNVARFSPADRL